MSTPSVGSWCVGVLGSREKEKSVRRTEEVDEVEKKEKNLSSYLDVSHHGAADEHVLDRGQLSILCCCCCCWVIRVSESGPPGEPERKKKEKNKKKKKKKKNSHLRVPLGLADADLGQLDVQVLVDAVEHARDRQVVLELDRDLLAHERLEEGVEDHFFCGAKGARKRIEF